MHEPFGLPVGFILRQPKMSESVRLRPERVVYGSVSCAQLSLPAWLHRKSLRELRYWYVVYSISIDLDAISEIK